MLSVCSQKHHKRVCDSFTVGYLHLHCIHKMHFSPHLFLNVFVLKLTIYASIDRNFSLVCVNFRSLSYGLVDIQPFVRFVVKFDFDILKV